MFFIVKVVCRFKEFIYVLISLVEYELVFSLIKKREREKRKVY